MTRLPRPHGPRILPLLVAVLVLWSLQAQAQDKSELALGKDLFLKGAEPRCAICHTLADAGANGKIGPNLDALKPTLERVKAAVTDGINAMPPYDELLTESEIEAVAEYVSTVAGQAK